MTRHRTWLVFATAAICAALATPASAPAKVIGCGGDGTKDAGIYNSDEDVRAFDLTLDPSVAEAASSLTLSATLCGADADDDLFYETFRLDFPKLNPWKEQFTCARPSPPVRTCDLDGNGSVDGSENIAERSYVGRATVDLWCNADLCAWTANRNQPDSDAEIYVDSDASEHCDLGDSNTIACFVAEGETDDAECRTDMTVNYASTTNGTTYRMYVYAPDCTASGLSIDDVYVTDISDVTLCARAGDADGTACGSTSDPPVFRNGIYGEDETYMFYLVGTMTDGTEQVATSEGTWSPPYPDCDGNNWPAGIYDDAGKEGAFDFDLSPTRASADSQLKIGATLCSDIEAGDYVDKLELDYDGGGIRIACALDWARIATDYCDRDGSGAVDLEENLPDNVYAGEAQLDLVCADEAFSCEAEYEAGAMDMRDFTTELHVDHDSSNCNSSVAQRTACFAMTGEKAVEFLFSGSTMTFDVTCEIDVFVASKRELGESLEVNIPIPGESTPIDTQELNILTPDCSVQSPWSADPSPLDPVYIANIDDIEFCKYVPFLYVSIPFRAEACESDGIPVHVNGPAGSPAGMYSAKLRASMTQGSDMEGAARGAWELFGGHNPSLFP